MNGKNVSVRDIEERITAFLADTYCRLYEDRVSLCRYINMNSEDTKNSEMNLEDKTSKEKS